MFFPTRGTPYDLRFSLFGIPVTITPFFWVMAGILGFSWLKVEPGGPANLVAWMLCVLVSILLHEFGHALTMRAFGHRPEVVLHHFGGYATYRGRAQETPWKSLLITMAGPGVQLVLWAILFFGVVPWLKATGRMPQSGTPLDAVLVSLLYINLFWPIINLIPVLPLDGGRILWALLAMAGARNAVDWTMRVSVVVGVGFAVVCLLMLGSFLAGAMFAFMAMDNYQSLKGQRFDAS